MIGAIGLTESDEKENSMEDNWLWYLSGVVDTVATMTVNINQNTSLKLNYGIKPQVSLSRPIGNGSLFGMLDEYCEANQVRVRISEHKKSNRLVIDDAHSIKNFLEPLAGGFVQQRERVDYYLDEVIPLFEDGSPDSKEEFIEVVEKFDELRRYPFQNKKTKFTSDYFKDVWSDELE